MKSTQKTDSRKNQKQERAPDQEAAAPEARILSVNADAALNTFRVSLQWQGNYDIADFDLQRFGRVLRIQDETANKGWAIIERAFQVPIAHRLPGWAINESTPPLSPGDTIPLRPDLDGDQKRE